MSPLAANWYEGGLVDVRQTSLWVSVASIVFNPLFWNIVARREYRTRFLTRWCGGAYQGCYVLAVTIFSIGIIRDNFYHAALKDQPTHKLLASSQVKVASGIFFVIGSTLVVTSMWALGVTGTYLGDYFGILMDSMVSGFPFNVSSSPMYDGSTLTFLATALWYESPAGILLTILVFIEYKIALRYEDPFTAAIYRARTRSTQQVSSTSSKLHVQ